ncbi:sn-glycerol-3-phosphate import ATP-binding protein UgpC [Aestuariispira ectoiniformans]|uniref:sn-glycerol-3-phosphate import ATP-binding protein UgpC n=1 Tax=Aestuariispira ectoiniformans TaxID=2775080 RepID=UPI00223AA424|nr:sn-glycerol-3-phosphate import ATP-binding protein UgpC [Aestuariispira ectoiniformans]
MATVSLKNIQKTYPNGFKAVHGIDLDIQDGEFIVIVGPSGCGKSTLLRMIAGLETISDGDLMIGSDRVNAVEPAARDIAMVFQNYALYPHMTVFNNMAYALKNRGFKKGEIKQRVEEAAKILELDHLLDRKPQQLSGGQRQRVAMGRAIVREPAVFLFDEPLSNLDAKLRVQMRLEIKQLQRRLGITSVYVTHDQIEAMTLADRLVVMNGGLPEQIGTPIEIYENPASTFVAGFIGSPSMNFIPGRTTEGGLQLPDGTTLQRKPSNGSSDCTVGLRPENLHRANGEKPDLELTVSVVEPLGADTLVYGLLDGMKEPIVARLNGRADIKEQERLPLRIEHDKLHLFDSGDGGKRLI